MPDQAASAPIINKIIPAWIVFVFIGLVVYFVWALNRGFEITDEAYYLHLGINSSAVKIYNSAQHWITSGLWFVTRSLFFFRGIGMLILLFSAWILAYGAINFCNNFSLTGAIETKGRITIFCTTLSAALLYGTTINFSPCYNLIAAATIYAAMGLVMLSLKGQGPYRMVLVDLLTGGILGIAILNKFSAGASMFLLVVLFIASFSYKLRTCLIKIGIIGGGMLFTIFLFVYSHMMTGNVIDEFRLGMEVFKQVQTETTSARLLRYVAELIEHLFWTGGILALIVALIYSFPNIRNFSLVRNLAIIIAIALGGYYLKTFFPLQSQELKWLGVQSVVISLILSISLIVAVSFWTRDKKTLLFTIALIMLPFCAAMGTGNALHTQAIISLAPWGTIIAVMAVAGKFSGYHQGLAMLLCGIFVSSIPFQVALSGRSPYHLNSPIWRQNTLTQIGDIGNVKTDTATHSYVKDIKQAILNGHIEKGKAFLGFYDLPGTALVMQGIPVFSPWLSMSSQAEVMLNRVDTNILKQATVGILLNRDGSLPMLPRQFKDFPTGYKLCGEANYPTFPYQNHRIQVWVPTN